MPAHPTCGAAATAAGAAVAGGAASVRRRRRWAATSTAPCRASRSCCARAAAGPSRRSHIAGAFYLLKLVLGVILRALSILSVYIFLPLLTQLTKIGEKKQVCRSTRDQIHTWICPNAEMLKPTSDLAMDLFWILSLLIYFLQWSCVKMAE